MKQHPKLGRVEQFDERSRGYQIAPLVRRLEPRSYTWRVLSRLAQEGPRCVGYGWVQELMARPLVAEIADPGALAKRIYAEAQRIDEWEGEDYGGTSVLAGAKIASGLGHFAEYRWAGAGSGSALEDLALAVGHKGPAVIGVNWYWDMFEPGSDGFIHPAGDIAGGHAILAHGVSRRLKHFRLHNSWGPGWGEDGGCYISFADMDRLLHEQGEACIPIGRRRVE